MTASFKEHSVNVNADMRLRLQQRADTDGTASTLQHPSQRSFSHPMGAEVALSQPESSEASREKRSQRDDNEKSVDHSDREDCGEQMLSQPDHEKLMQSHPGWAPTPTAADFIRLEELLPALLPAQQAHGMQTQPDSHMQIHMCTCATSWQAQRFPAPCQQRSTLEQIRQIGHRLVCHYSRAF